MTTPPYSLSIRWLPLLILLSLFLLSGCSQTTAGPSAALKQQFYQLQQQQRLQAEQINFLQQQLAQLQQQPADFPPAIVAEQPAQFPLPGAATAKPIEIPAAASRELNALADSAASYLQAFSSLAAGRFAAAESGFNHFLSNYPEHQYSPNARYWLASAQLSQGKHQLASSSLRQLLVDRDGQQRAPAALVLLARVYQQQNLGKEADEVLEQLRNRYPESTEAQQFFNNTEPEQQL